MEAKMNPTWFLLLILTGMLWSPALRAQERMVEPPGSQSVARIPTVTVTGNGEASAAPDQAVVRLGTTVQTSQADAAQATVNGTMQKALDAIVKLGIPRGAVRTATLTLASVYSSSERPVNNPEPPHVVGFRASNTIEVTLDDTKLVGKVIDAGIAAGANELQGVSFALQNDIEQRRTALVNAASEAKTKAQTIAGALDVPLGPVLEVIEGGAHVIPLNEGFGGARMMAAVAVNTPVEPGEVRVQANVTVRYRINTAQDHH
jgi:uncharacterized protein YggE